MAERFRELAERLSDSESKIVDELNDVQGSSVDIGGYYRPDREKVEKAMRPSETLNEALNEFESRRAVT